MTSENIRGTVALMLCGGCQAPLLVHSAMARDALPRDAAPVAARLPSW